MMSRHLTDLRTRRQSHTGVVSTSADSNPHLVEAAKPPRTSQAERPKKASTGRVLPTVPYDQMQEAAKPYSDQDPPRRQGADVAQAQSAVQRRTRKTASVAGIHTSPQAQATDFGRSISGPDVISAQYTTPGRDLLADNIAEELETSNGFVAPPGPHQNPTENETKYSRRGQRKFSLPVSPVRGSLVVPSNAVRRPSYGSTYSAAAPARRRSSTGTGIATDRKASCSRKTSTRKTSTMQLSNLKEQWTMRVDVHLHSLSLMQRKQANAHSRCVDFSRSSVNLSVSLGTRVDTSSSFELERSAATDLPGTAEFTSSSLQQALSIPVSVGIPLDNPEKFLSKDVRITAEYGQRDLLTTSKSLGTLNWRSLASGSLDVTQYLKPDMERFPRQMNIPLVMHQMHASTTTSCVVDCTVRLTVLQRKTGQEIDTSEEFSFDEDVFEYLDMVDDDSDGSCNEDTGIEDDTTAAPEDLPDGSQRRLSAVQGASRSSRVSASAAARRPKKSAPAKRPSRVSATDAPSDAGQDPMHSTAAFAYEGAFNRLGLLHVSIVSAKCQTSSFASSTSSALQEGDKVSVNAEINGGLTKQVSPPTTHSPGLLMKWDPENPHFTFYTLKSRQVFLSLCRKAAASAASSSTKGHSSLGLGNVLLSDVVDLSDQLPLTYAQPSVMQFLRDEAELQRRVKLSPNGEVTAYLSFRSLRSRQPCSCKLRVRSVTVSGLSLPSSVQRLACAIKVDGVFKGMSSEGEVEESEASWSKDRFSEVSCSDAVDLEVHVWSRSASKQGWAAYGVLPIAVVVQRQLEAAISASSQPSDGFNSSIKQELWLPLEPQGFVQVEVMVGNGGTLSSQDSKESTAAEEEDVASQIPDKENSAGSMASPRAKPIESPDELLDPLLATRKKSDPKWEDLLQLLKDRVELRKEVEFLHEALRSAKAQLAESEFEKQKSNLENRHLHDRLRAAKKQTKKIAQKATHLELKELMAQLEDEEIGYSTA